MTTAINTVISFAVFALLFTQSVNAAVMGKITREIIEETVERAAKRSGREGLEKAAKASAGETLERLAKTYGDDAIRVVDDAGLEFLEAAPRYGDDVVALSLKVSPQARRAFAQNIPELLPIARRAGTEVLELEAKSPGLGVRVFQHFGDDAGRVIARSVPAEDVPRLLKYAEKADNPATKKMLLESYEKEGPRLFERVPAKLVLASGLTAAMLYGTHQATAPARALGGAIANNEAIAETAVKEMCKWGFLAIVVMGSLVFWRFGIMPWHRPRQSKALTQKESAEQHHEANADEANADEANADEANADEANADEANADEANADEATTPRT